MSRKSEIRDLVLGILLENEKARNSDRWLYYEVLKVTNPEALGKTFVSVILNPEIPKLETVSRARRWCQSKFEATRPTETVEALRELEEEEYKDLFNNKQAWKVAKEAI